MVQPTRCLRSNLLLLLYVLKASGAKQITEIDEDLPTRSGSMLQTQKQLAPAALKSSCSDSELVCQLCLSTVQELVLFEALPCDLPCGHQLVLLGAISVWLPMWLPRCRAHLQMEPPHLGEFACEPSCRSALTKLLGSKFGCNMTSACLYSVICTVPLGMMAATFAQRAQMAARRTAPTRSIIVTCRRIHQHSKDSTGAQSGLTCLLQKCPEACNSTELACAAEDGGGICVPREAGCPVKCKKHEHRCHSPPARADGSGLNWCAEADSPCPLYNCSKGQVACLEDEVYTCYDRRDGCPANCSKHQHVCHSAPEADCPDCVAVNWCSDEKCPEACSDDEITCLHKHGTTCRLLSQGCPVHCNASQHSCHSPPPCKGCTGSNWCSDVPCPFVCASDEIQCTGSNGTEFCAAVADGCPVTCRDEDYICHMPPQCPECVGTNWCSAEPCATSV
ncbi:ndor1 [Symbiodinium necroappetens]|uniref:Ndor1 protein n=1 Tax=Symbiodinium necroappetens TaxID=1628268 RepID=A0A812VQR9_9DINO|nr:ndor1 [Symbiodinium necroappetens]